MPNVTPPLPAGNNKKKETRVFPALGFKEVMGMIKRKCAPVGMKLYGSGKHKVVILPEAWDELKQMIYFGKRHPVNTYEQQYQGMGHIFVDASNTVTVVVSHFLYIYSATRGATFASVVKGVNDSMLERLEMEREIYNKFESTHNKGPGGHMYDPFVALGASEVVLFGHTHPNLGVFFSPPDRASSYATTTLPAATFVCDPIRKDMKAMVGLGEEDAQVCVCEYVVRRAKPPVKDTKVEKENTEELIAKLGQNCNEILTRGAQGKYTSYYAKGGKLCVNFKMQYDVEHNKNDSRSNEGNSYDKYA